MPRAEGKKGRKEGSGSRRFLSKIPGNVIDEGANKAAGEGSHAEWEGSPQKKACESARKVFVTRSGVNETLLFLFDDCKKKGETGHRLSKD